MSKHVRVSKSVILFASLCAVSGLWGAFFSSLYASLAYEPLGATSLNFSTSLYTSNISWFSRTCQVIHISYLSLFRPSKSISVFPYSLHLFDPFRLHACKCVDCWCLCFQSECLNYVWPCLLKHFIFLISDVVTVFILWAGELSKADHLDTPALILM